MPLSLGLKKGYEHAKRCSYIDEEGAELSLSAFASLMQQAA